MAGVPNCSCWPVTNSTRFKKKQQSPASTKAEQCWRRSFSALASRYPHGMAALFQGTSTTSYVWEVIRLPVAGHNAAQTIGYCLSWTFLYMDFRAFALAQHQYICLHLLCGATLFLQFLMATSWIASVPQNPEGRGYFSRISCDHSRFEDGMLSFPGLPLVRAAS